MKHLEVKQLWLQEQVRSGKVDFQKVPRKSNPSDALTHCTKEDAKKHFKHMGLEELLTSRELGRGEVRESRRKSSCMRDLFLEPTPWL